MNFHMKKASHTRFNPRQKFGKISLHIINVTDIFTEFASQLRSSATFLLP